MDLISKSFIKKILNEKGICPSKKLGQNFLISRTVLAKIIETADIQKTDVILEIGPGIGTLTQELAKLAKKVIAIEKDKKMVEILKETLKELDNVEIIQADILKMNKEQRTPKTALPTGQAKNNKKEGLFTVHCSLFTDYKVVANLPYYITSPVIRKFLEEKNPPKEMILMVQKEVAQRITAKPPHLRQGFGGQAKMNLLAISVQFYARPKIISYVSKKCFWPEPKVNSAIIKLTVNRQQLTVNSKLFFQIVKAGFAHPRKQVVNNLLKELKLDKEEVRGWLNNNKIKPEQRAQTLTLEDWINLTKTLK